MVRPKKEQPNRADGLYEVKITVGKDFNGKLIRKSFYSSISKTDAKAQAEKYKIEQEVANRTGVGFVSKDVTFSDWAIKWLETDKKGNVSENTYSFMYKNTVERHLIPYFGKGKLTNIRNVDVQAFFATKKEMSQSMLDKMRICLVAIFDTAIENDLCYKNPAKKVAAVSNAEKNIKKVYSVEQIESVKLAACNNSDEVVIFLETGLRRGELLGLQWSDIDFENEVLSVNRSVADSKQLGIRINPPKWNSYRKIPLKPMSIEFLQRMERISDYVFPMENGQPQKPHSWSQKLDRFMDTLPEDIPRLTAHELRHTFGTDLRRQGVDIYTIQKVMGHKDIKMTSELYVHNEIDELKKAMKL